MRVKIKIEPAVMEDEAHLYLKTEEELRKLLNIDDCIWWWIKRNHDPVGCNITNDNTVYYDVRSITQYYYAYRVHIEMPYPTALINDIKDELKNYKSDEKQKERVMFMHLEIDSLTKMLQAFFKNDSTIVETIYNPSLRSLADQYFKQIRPKLLEDLEEKEKRYQDFRKSMAEANIVPFPESSIEELEKEISLLQELIAQRKQQEQEQK